MAEVVLGVCGFSPCQYHCTSFPYPYFIYLLLMLYIVHNWQCHEMQHHEKNNGPKQNFGCFLGVPRHMLGYFLKGIHIHFCLILSLLSFYFLILCNMCCCHTENIKHCGNCRPRIYWFLILSVDLHTYIHTHSFAQFHIATLLKEMEYVRV
jgi:hypothetical protein